MKLRRGIKEMESNQKLWNKGQKEFRQTLLSFDQHDEAIRLFLRQHAMLHSAKVSQSDAWSYEDEILDDMSAEQVRRIPRNCEHSVAWVIWHIARIEDVTMNLLVAGTPQLLHRDNWLERMKITIHHAGNAMDEGSMAELNATIDLDAMRAYRVAVGRRTCEIVKGLQPDALKQKVEADRLGKVWDEGAVVEAARGIVDYWSKRNIAGLLLMPPTRHNFLHLNEAARLKQRRQ
jgi:hypothetical protein